MLQKLLIVATIGAGTALGLLWPTSHEAAPARAGRPAEVVIQRGGDHHYYADATVNGQPVRFMIDTGASETALTEEDAKGLGLDVDPAKYEVIGDGASGMVRGQYVQLKSIDLNGISQRDARAVVVQGAAVSLLGQPFLEKVDEIVIRQGEMRMTSETSP